MHSATTATGRPLPPPGKTPPKNRPAPLSCRAARQLAAPKPHVTSQLQCYIPAPAVTYGSSLIISHCKFNRQPRRLESSVSHTKQTPAPQFNRQQIATPQITNHYSPTCLAGRRVTTHRRSNRQWQILEINVNLSKQTIAPRSNRHKNAVIKRQNVTNHDLAIIDVRWDSLGLASLFRGLGDLVHLAWLACLGRRLAGGLGGWRR